MCVARFNSVLTSLPPLPFHSLSTPSPLLPSWMCEYHHQAAPIGIAVRPWRVVWVTADNMQSAVPLSLLFSFLAPPAMLRTDCCCFAHREEQQHSPGSRTCGPLPIAPLRANLQLSPLLILCSLLLCAISHSMDAMSRVICCRCACRGLAWGRRESLQICSWHFPRHKYASQPTEMPIIFLKPRSSHP